MLFLEILFPKIFLNYVYEFICGIWYLLIFIIVIFLEDLINLRYHIIFITCQKLQLNLRFDQIRSVISL